MLNVQRNQKLEAESVSSDVDGAKELVKRIGKRVEKLTFGFLLVYALTCCRS